MTQNNILLNVKQLKKHFPVHKGILRREVGQVKAVDGINLFVNEGETLGIVGESGCGKTTAGRSILRLTDPSSGKVLFRCNRQINGTPEGDYIDVASAPDKVVRQLRRDMQIIFQDPYSSLNPRLNVKSIISEPLIVFGEHNKSALEDRVLKLLKAVGLKSEHMNRYPHEFSGGQRQRIGIARAIALEPKLVVADEPVSALDVSIQAQVVNLLEELQVEFGLTYLFIAHDLSIVKHISDRVAVMYLGKIVELAKTDQLFADLKHPYTEALISAVPVPDPDKKSKRIILEGDVPNPVNPPSGCSFHPRCQYARSLCKTEEPEFQDIGGEHFVACHFAKSLSLRAIGVKQRQVIPN